MHKICPGRKAQKANYETINNSDLDGVSLVSFCQSRAVFGGYTFCPTPMACESFAMRYVDCRPNFIESKFNRKYLILH